MQVDTTKITKSNIKFILDICLHLKEIKYLFVNPELNPFDCQRASIIWSRRSGKPLRTKERRVEMIRLNIFLPQGQIKQIKPGLQEKRQMIYPNIVISGC